MTEDDVISECFCEYTPDIMDVDMISFIEWTALMANSEIESPADALKRCCC